jgi:hypothetical protein
MLGFFFFFFEQFRIYYKYILYNNIQYIIKIKLLGSINIDTLPNHVNFFFLVFSSISIFISCQRFSQQILSMCCCISGYGN